MFLVNFLGGLAVIPAVLKHNNTFFSYADSIMPSFLFAAGFSYRLTTRKRLPQQGWFGMARRTLSRSFGLVLVSLAMYGAEDLGGPREWSGFGDGGALRLIAATIKADLWEVLAIIGLVQVLLLPVIAARPRVRLAALFGVSALHVLLSHLFNYDFVYGEPNGLDTLLGTEGRRAWDGGTFGLLHWAVPMLAGTLVFDLMAAVPRWAAAGRLVAWGALVMLAAFLSSGLSTLYTTADRRADGNDLAASPVRPPLERLGADSFAGLAEAPPFVEPDFQARNYWMMDKRIVSASFIWFSTGFAMALYGLFVLACDLGGLSVWLFRLLGQNPLAAYVIHHAIEGAVLAVVPRDAPLWYVLVALTVFFVWTVMFVRYLDRRKIYLRL